MIRKANENDFDFMFALYMHPDINPYLLYEQMDRSSFRPIYQDLQQRGILYIYSADGQDIGMFKLMPLSYRNAHIAYLGGLAIDPAFGGKGFGRQMMHEIIAFAGQQGFLRIELSVATINDKAIRLYAKAGFEKEGVFKKYTFLQRENRYLDEVLMAYLFNGENILK